MASKKLRKIAYFLRRWKNGVMYAGYNSKGVLCLYLRIANDTREIPFSWEYICDCGLKQAWNDVKNFWGDKVSVAYDPKSEQLIDSGFFEV